MITDGKLLYSFTNCINNASVFVSHDSREIDPFVSLVVAVGMGIASTYSGRLNCNPNFLRPWFGWCSLLDFDRPFP
jgi:hypothetical protein